MMALFQKAFFQQGRGFGVEEEEGRELQEEKIGQLEEEEKEEEEDGDDSDK